MPTYEEMSRSELFAHAKENGVKTARDMSKVDVTEELIAAGIAPPSDDPEGESAGLESLLSAPAIDESLEDQFEADTAVAAKAPPVAAAVPPESKPSPSDKGSLTRTELAALVEQEATELGVPLEKVDPFKLIRSKGWPNPTSVYQVGARRMTKNGPVLLESARMTAVDESAAIAEYLTLRRVKDQDRHRYNVTAVCVEE